MDISWPLESVLSESRCPVLHTLALRTPPFSALLLFSTYVVGFAFIEL